MKKRRTKIIKDKKERGEWAESVFIARATEEGLPASKPWGDTRSYDCVVGRPGKFVAVQVKCTIFKNPESEGYICSTSSSHKRYRPGAFDFLAAYVIPEDSWYIIPAKLILGKKAISLCTVSGEAKYEEYREAWHILRKASEIHVVPPEAELGKSSEFPRSSALGRMQTALGYFKSRMEHDNLRPPKGGK